MAGKPKPKPKPKPRPVGRPTLYKPEYCQLLIQHMKEGFSYETFAAVTDVSIQTLYDWEKAHPEFLEAKNHAWPKRQLFWEGLNRGITAGKIKGNPATMIFTLKNANGWRDKHDIQTTDTTKEKALENLSDKELRAYAKKILEEGE